MAEKEKFSKPSGNAIGAPGIARQFVAASERTPEPVAEPAVKQARAKKALAKAEAPKSKKSGRGRPKITEPRPWEIEGISRATYDRRRAAQREKK